MKQFIPIITQDGKVMKYLNMRAVQSGDGIIIDQSHQIKSTILDSWFPPETATQLKGVFHCCINRSSSHANILSATKTHNVPNNLF